MKNNLILTTFMLWRSFGLFAQNPLTILPPNCIQHNSSGTVSFTLQTGLGINDYHGQKTECTSNAFPDDQRRRRAIEKSSRAFDGIVIGKKLNSIQLMIERILLISGIELVLVPLFSRY